VVFLNACQTGRGAMSLTGVGGWARHFIESGASVFIGSLWAVNDEAAWKFTESFYSLLLSGAVKGMSIGQVVRLARTAIRQPNNPTWLSYVVFGDPLAVVTNA